MATTSYVRWFSELSLADVAQAGSKNASLDDLYRELGVPVPCPWA